MVCIGLIDTVLNTCDYLKYFTVEEATIEEIRSLAASGASMNNITDTIQKKARIGPELIEYITKNKITA